MTLEEIARLCRKFEQVIGPQSSIRQAAEVVNRRLEECSRAARQAELMAARCNDLSEKAIGATEAAAQRWDSYLRQYERNLNYRTQAATFWARTTTEQALRFEQATTKLEAGQRARVNQVLEDWARISSVQPSPESRPSFLARFGDWLLGRRRRAKALEEYLGDAHRHPAVARKERGRRRWFEDWRREALIALQLGLDVREFFAIASVAPIQPRRRNEQRPCPGGEAEQHGFLGRLAHAIFPNAPNNAHLTRRPASEMGWGS